MFATGAVMLALSLLTPTLLGSFKSKRLAAFMSEDSTPNEPPIRLYPAASGKNEVIRHPNNNSNDKITPDSYALSKSFTFSFNVFFFLPFSFFIFLSN